MFSSARKNLTSLKMSFFSWFEVDSRAMFKFLVSPPSWKLIGSICEATGGKETCYQSPILPLGLRRFLGHNLSTRASSRECFRFFAFCIFLTRRKATISQRKLSSSFNRLRTWLSCRVGTAKDGSASSDANKRELMHCRWAVDVRSFFLPTFRAGITVFFLAQTYITLSFCRVVSYIKNGWENILNESLNKRLASDAKNNVDVSTLSTSSPNTRHEFPQAANWCSIQRAEFHRS